MNHILPLLVAAAMFSAPGAAAQTVPAAPAGQPLGGPLIAGVCLLSREAIFANAKIARAANERLQQLAAEAQAEVDAERKPVEEELKKFRAESAKLSPEQRTQREQALNARLQPLQAKAQLRAREIEATRARALGRISDEAQPVIAQVYRAKNCGLLIDRGSVLGGNFGNDLTPAAVQALDAKISTITFNRETLPPAPATSATTR
jgi:Skp family chaperone for outer membrane proteins